MNIIFETWKAGDTLHHAYFLTGEREKIAADVRHFLETRLELQTNGNPDFWHGKFDTLNAESVREIIESHQSRSFAENGNSTLTLPRKIFIIETDFISEGAQNALLKIFEEPNPGTHFFIISPQDILLPTLRSRMQVLRVAEKTKPNKEHILHLKLNERLTLVKGIADDISDENKTKQDAIALLNAIENELYSNGVQKNATKLKVCEHARASLYDNGAPIKMILENVMLNV